MYPHSRYTIVYLEEAFSSAYDAVDPGSPVLWGISVQNLLIERNFCPDSFYLLRDESACDL